MLHNFLANNRADLIARCKGKVALRPFRAATEEQLRNGIPIFLEQLQRTLEVEEVEEGSKNKNNAKSVMISGAAGGDASNLSEIGMSATAHGKQLLELGFTVDQVVHDYGDLCQAITDLAVERDAPFGVDEFRTLNRCLDNAIADAVTEFSFQRDVSLAQHQQRAADQRIGFLAHEVRNALSSATYALHALETGSLPVGGATGHVLKRALVSMTHLINAAVEDVRGKTLGEVSREVLALELLVSEAAWSARLYAEASGATLNVPPVDAAIDLHINRERIMGAIANLLQNAFKFTQPGTQVTLNATSYGAFVNIEVSDHCGGLPHGDTESMFAPFAQRNADRSGLGLGLAIARQSAEADGGTLTARDVPGHGCVFVLTLPRYRGVRLST